MGCGLCGYASCSLLVRLVGLLVFGCGWCWYFVGHMISCLWVLLLADYPTICGLLCFVSSWFS